MDGVISLFDFDPACPPAGQYVMVDGIVHLLSATAGVHLRKLAGEFELAWCTGWEEKANEYLRPALELAGSLPCLHFSTGPGAGPHWKLSAIDEYAGLRRPVAWIDDTHDESCRRWAAARPAPTLLVTSDPAVGLTAEHVTTLVGWAGLVGSGRRQRWD